MPTPKTRTASKRTPTRTKQRPAGTKPVLVNVPEASLAALDRAVDDLRRDPIHRNMTRTALILVGIDLAVAKYGAKVTRADRDKGK